MQWAVESRDGAARLAFRQMATAWARLAFNEEFTSPAADEHSHPLTSEISEIPVEYAASSPAVPPPTVIEKGTAASNPGAEEAGNYEHTTRTSTDKTLDLSCKHIRLSLRSPTSFLKR